jgi:hypothetical protein
MSKGFLVPKWSYVNPRTNDNPHIDPNVSIEKVQAEIVARVLHAHYPGQPWKVVADNDGKIVKFQIPVLMGVTNWYVISFDTLKQHDRAIATIVKFGGEILERYQIPRSRFSLDHFLTAKALIPPQRKFHGFLPG